MPRLRREYETPLILVVTSALLVLAVLGEWGVKTLSHRAVRESIEQQARAGGDVTEDQAAEKDFALAEVERFTDLVERPLFFQGRRPPVQVDAAKPDKPFDAQLHGVVDAPGGTLALLKEKDGKYHRLREKEMLLGWRLAAILSDRVRLERGAEKMELLLQKPKPKEAASGPAAGQGGGKPDKSRKIEPNPKTEKVVNE
jgi:hypothetical protein